jgi:hypothetical protein
MNKPVSLAVGIIAHVSAYKNTTQTHFLAQKKKEKGKRLRRAGDITTENNCAIIP